MATQFTVAEDDPYTLIPPFIVIDGLGENVALSVIKAREGRPFLSQEDLIKRTSLSQTLVRKLADLGCLNDLQERNQMSLF